MKIRQTTIVDFLETGRNCYASSDYAGAIHAYEKYLSQLQLPINFLPRHTGMREAFARRAWCQWCAGHHQQAIADYDILLQYDKANGFDYLSDRADCKREMGDYASAAQDYAELWTMDMDDYFVLLDWADCLRAAGEWDQSIVVYDRLLKSLPYASIAHYGKAMARHAMGDVKGALQDCQKAMTPSPDPDDPAVTFHLFPPEEELYQLRGSLYYLLGEISHATADWSKARQIREFAEL